MSVERPCDVCGEFYEAKRPNSRFCSATCRQRSARKGSTDGSEPDQPEAGPTASGSVSTAAESGSHLATLEALRDTLARQIDSSRDPFGLPSLADKLVKVLAEIAKLRPPEQAKGTVVDEIAKRRAARGADTASQRDAERGSR